MFSHLDKRWRLIAQTFHPWDDEHTLTLQHSNVLDGSASYVITTNAQNTSLEGYNDIVNAGVSFNHLLTAIAGYAITSVTITMGGTDITSTAYNSTTGQISIASVTGNVVIAVAVGRPYDAEVEYLQGDGTAYIDTQYTPVQGDEITVEFQSLATISSSYYCLFSSGTGTYQFIALFGNRQNVTGSFCKYFASGAAQWLAHSFSGWETMTIKQDGTFSIGSDSVRSPYEHSLDGNNTSLFILRRRDNTSGLPAKLRKFSITNNNVTKKDFIPVRKDGVGYLYDKVSGQLFGNAASSGAFTYGNDVTT
jgi:hypothetical protein